MQTPTVFLIGKLSNAIEEINKGTGSTWTYVSFGENAHLKVLLTLPELTNEIYNINSTKEKLIGFFGLNESDCRISVHNNYGKTRIEIFNRTQELVIVAESERQ